MAKYWIMAALCLAALSLPAVADGQIVTLPHPSVVINGHVMVPVRDFFESLGGSVSFDRATQTITATRNAHVATMTMGSHSGRIDGQIAYLPVSPCEIGDAAMVPVDFASQAAGVQVSFVPPVQPVAVGRQTIYLGSPGPTPIYWSNPAPVYLGSASAPALAPASASYLAITSLDPQPWTKVHPIFDLDGKTAPFANVRVTEMGAVEISTAPGSRTLVVRNQPRDFLATANEDGDFSVQIDARRFLIGSHIVLQVQAKDANGLSGSVRSLDLVTK